jgi:alpha-1,2-mannosyltransferase
MQPHKEERFMYVVYPLICLNAALALDSCRSMLQRLFRFVGFAEAKEVSRWLVWAIISAQTLLSLGRELAQIRAYSGPMQVVSDVDSPSLICYGKEWYRFPSSFFVPSSSRAAFIKSEFSGLLPGKFNESDERGWRSGVWQIPSGMNDQNQEDLSHLVYAVHLILMFR